MCFESNLIRTHKEGYVAVFDWTLRWCGNEGRFCKQLHPNQVLSVVWLAVLHY